MTRSNRKKVPFRCELFCPRHPRQHGTKFYRRCSHYHSHHHQHQHRHRQNTSHPNVISLTYTKRAQKYNNSIIKAENFDQHMMFSDQRSRTTARLVTTMVSSWMMTMMTMMVLTFLSVNVVEGFVVPTLQQQQRPQHPIMSTPTTTVLSNKRGTITTPRQNKIRLSLVDDDVSLSCFRFVSRYIR